MTDQEKIIELLYKKFIQEVEEVFKKDFEQHKKYFSGTPSVSSLSITLNRTNPETILFKDNEITNSSIVNETYKKIGKYEYLFTLVK